MRLARALSLASLLAAMGHARPAAAQDAQTDAVVAETLFREGRALLEAGKPDKACPKLADSYRLDPRTGTLMNVAACHEMEGRLATAWAEFLEAARRARVRSTPDAARLEETARNRASLLEPKLHRIEVTVDGPTDDLVLALDGKELPASAWSTPFPCDPGHHELEARRPGRAPTTLPVDLPAAPGKTTIRVPRAAPLPPQATASQPGPLAAVSAPPPPGPAHDQSRLSSPVFWGAAGATVVAAGVGTFFGLRAIAAKNDRDANCTSAGCSSVGLDHQSQAFDASRISTVSFVVAGVAAAVAIGVLLWPSSAGTSRVALRERASR
jgi:hypothetical protein